VTKGLLDDDPRVLRQSGLRQALDHRAEEKRRDLEVEDRELGSVDCLGDPLVGRRVGEITRDVGEPLGEAVEHLRLDLLARTLDRRPSTFLQIVDRPVVHRDSDDRAVEEAAPLEAVEGHESHHFRQVARDPEGHEHVSRLTGLIGLGPGFRGSHGRRHRRLSSLRWARRPRSLASRLAGANLLLQAVLGIVSMG
jgi:hypothetical protein